MELVLRLCAILLDRSAVDCLDLAEEVENVEEEWSVAAGVLDVAPPTVGALKSKRGGLEIEGCFLDWEDADEALRPVPWTLWGRTFFCLDLRMLVACDVPSIAALVVGLGNFFISLSLFDFIEVARLEDTFPSTLEECFGCGLGCGLVLTVSFLLKESGSSATWCRDIGLLDELMPEEDGLPRLLAARNSKGLYFDA